jgi:transposase InsO family protein
MNKMFLVLSDAFSKWLDVFVTTGSTTQKTVEKLRHTFAIHSVPATLVSDNGPCFTSEDFAAFCKKNSIRHVTSAPYHPATNGLAERSVQTFKNTMKKWKNNGDSVNAKVERFLFAYRNIPHAATGISPAEMLLKRRPRTGLSLIKPNLSQWRVTGAKASMKNP